MNKLINANLSQGNVIFHWQRPTATTESAGVAARHPFQYSTHNCMNTGELPLPEVGVFSNGVIR